MTEQQSLVAAPEPGAVRSRRGLFIGSGVLALVLVLGGVGTAIVLSRRSPSAQAAPSTPATTTAAATPSPTPTKPSRFTGDLRTLFVPLPAGAKEVPNVISSPDGTVNIEQLARDGDDKMSKTDATAEADRLQSLGFQRGAVIEWSIRAGKTGYFGLYQFEDADGASRWSARTAGAGVATSGDIPGIPGGKYFSYTDPLPGGDYYVICDFSRNDIAAELDYFTRSGPDVNALIALAQAQYALLP